MLKEKKITANSLTYGFDKNFTQKDVEKLFLSVWWVSGRYPKRLYRALMNSSLVATAKDGNRLVGLVRCFSDGVMLAYVHYVLVDPEYQGQGIASKLINMVKEHYKGLFYVEVMPEDKKNASFYEKHGFSLMPQGCAMQTVNEGIIDA